MLIKIINPNTTASMTATIAKTARSVAGPDTRVHAVSPATGPASIESHYDEARSVPGVLTEIAAGERDGVAGYVIACFGDPGLDAAREIATGPVVGIAEAAMRTAGYLGRGFSVVTTLARSRGRTWDLAERYGLRGLCRGVHACGIPVLDLDSGPATATRLTSACRDAMAQDESDAIVLGCAGMTDLCAAISHELGIPVVDGVAAATLTVQSLVTMGLTTGALGEFAPPPPKHYLGGIG